MKNLVAMGVKFSPVSKKKSYSTALIAKKRIAKKYSNLIQMMFVTTKQLDQTEIASRKSDVKHGLKSK